MTLSYIYHADLLQQMAEISPDTIVSRTLFSSPQAKVILFGFAAGQELSEHTAARPAVLHVLQGQARLTVGGEAMSASPGAWLHMAPNLPHTVYAETPVLLLLYLLG